MKIEGEILDKINLAFNESRIVDCVINKIENKVVTEFETLSLLENGLRPKDRTVEIHFEGVSQVSINLKFGEWNNEDAPIKKLQVEEISKEVRDFKGQEMYGWDFVNTPNSEVEFNKWKDNASLSISLSENNALNTIDIFSEHFSKISKTLDIRIYFEEFSVKSKSGESIDLKEFVERGFRAWNAVYNENQQLETQNGGILVSGANPKKKKKRNGFFDKFKNLLK
nr:hypothetical protein [uncultured Allomuricauda sp.]